MYINVPLPAWFEAAYQRYGSAFLQELQDHLESRHRQRFPNGSSRQHERWWQAAQAWWQQHGQNAQEDIEELYRSVIQPKLQRGKLALRVRSALRRVGLMERACRRQDRHCGRPGCRAYAMRGRRLCRAHSRRR